MTAQDNAHLMASHALRVVPIGVGQKHPPIHEWQIAATSESETIDAWFDSHPEWGLGWKMGAQDDGRWLFAIDVDVNKGGRESFRDLIEEYGLADEFKATTTARTGGGGFHFVFQLPDDASIIPNNRSRLRAGIDVRAEGGQIVVAPTVHPTTHKAYAWEPGKAPWQLDPQVASAALMQMIADLQAPVPLVLVDEVSASVARHPSQQGGALSPADFVHYRWDFATFLNKHGWEWMGGERWRRPDKWDRGASAMLKGDGLGPLNVFTTEIPEALEHLGKLDATGQCISVTLFNFVAAYEHDGDTTALSRRVMTDPAYLAHIEEAGVVPLSRAGGTAPPSFEATPARLPTLPPEFWDHPFNAHVLAAARARRCGPDALALNVLLRASILVPPSLLLPPLTGGFSPINLLGCVVGRTGEGKSVSIAAAADVLGIEHPWLRWDMPLGSGEGVGDVFMVDETEDDEKGRKRKTGRRVQNPDLHAVHFVVDEGAALVEQTNRKGATIIPALCKAWTGAVLGETNIAVNSRRVRALSYRVSAVINIQPVNFHRLFNTANTGTGLTGRFLFAPAADYDMPDERGEWPGRMPFPELHGSAYGGALDYHPDIYAEVDAAIVHANRHGGTPENVSHSNLLRARVAAIYALSEERRTISPSDWHVAGLLTATSASILSTLDSQAQSSQSAKKKDQAIEQGELAYVAESATERRAIIDYKSKVLARLKSDLAVPFGTDAGLGKMTSFKRRWMIVQAVDELVAEGVIVKHGDRYELAP